MSAYTTVVSVSFTMMTEASTSIISTTMPYLNNMFVELSFRFAIILFPFSPVSRIPYLCTSNDGRGCTLRSRCSESTICCIDVSRVRLL